MPRLQSPAAVQAAFDAAEVRREFATPDGTVVCVQPATPDGGDALFEALEHQLDRRGLWESRPPATTRALRLRVALRLLQLGRRQALRRPADQFGLEAVKECADLFAVNVRVFMRHAPSVLVVPDVADRALRTLSLLVEGSLSRFGRVHSVELCVREPPSPSDAAPRLPPPSHFSIWHQALDFAAAEPRRREPLKRKHVRWRDDDRPPSRVEDFSSDEGSRSLKWEDYGREDSRRSLKRQDYDSEDGSRSLKRQDYSSEDSSRRRSLKRQDYDSEDSSSSRSLKTEDSRDNSDVGASRSLRVYSSEGGGRSVLLVRNRGEDGNSRPLKTEPNDDGNSRTLKPIRSYHGGSLKLELDGGRSDGGGPSRTLQVRCGEGGRAVTLVSGNHGRVKLEPICSDEDSEKLSDISSDEDSDDLKKLSDCSDYAGDLRKLSADDLMVMTGELSDCSSDDDLEEWSDDDWEEWSDYWSDDELGDYSDDGGSPQWEDCGSDDSGAPRIEDFGDAEPHFRSAKLRRVHREDSDATAGKDASRTRAAADHAGGWRRTASLPDAVKKANTTGDNVVRMLSARPGNVARLATVNMHSRGDYAAGSVALQCRLVADQLRRHKVDVAAVQQAKWPGADVYQVPGTEYTLIRQGYPEGREPQPALETGFMVRTALLRACVRHSRLSPRVSRLDVRAAPRDLSLLCAHAPPADATDAQMDDFYGELGDLLASAPRHALPVVLGDFNAQVGREEAVRSLAGQCSLHPRTDGHGQRLVRFARRHDLVISSTRVDRPDLKKMTWMSADRATLAQVDHMLVPRRFAACLHDVRTLRCRGAVLSDHWTVAATVSMAPSWRWGRPLHPATTLAQRPRPLHPATPPAQRPLALRPDASRPKFHLATPKTSRRGQLSSRCGHRWTRVLKGL